MSLSSADFPSLILVTGAAGTVGRAVIRQLLQPGMGGRQFRVRAFDRVLTEGAHEAHVGDMTDAQVPTSLSFTGHF
jgi:nucleoside-diphosphate-sugar epimerase